jgi:hypothetical protein
MHACMYAWMNVCIYGTKFSLTKYLNDLRPGMYACMYACMHECTHIWYKILFDEISKRFATWNVCIYVCIYAWSYVHDAKFTVSKYLNDSRPGMYACMYAYMRVCTWCKIQMYVHSNVCTWCKIHCSEISKRFITWNVCMHVYTLYKILFVQLSENIPPRMNVCTRVCMHICVCMHACMHAHMCMYARVYACTYVFWICTHTCVYINMCFGYVRIHVYI